MRPFVLATLALIVLSTANGKPQIDPVWAEEFPANGDSAIDSRVAGAVGLKDGSFLIGSARRVSPTVVESVITKLDANGVRVWESVFGASQSATSDIQNYRFGHIEESDSGDIFATRGRAGTLSAIWLSPDGQLLTSKGISGTARAMPDGGFVTAGEEGGLHTVVRRFRRDGSLVWARSLRGTVTKLVVDALGNAFLYGRNQDLQDVPHPMMAVRITPAGEVRGSWCQFDQFCTSPWPGWFDREDIWNDWGLAPFDFVLDPRGHAYMLLGSVFGGIPGRIAAFDRTGAMTWTFEVSDVAPAGTGFRLVVDDDGSLRILTSVVQGATAEYVITRLSADGTELWTRTSPVYQAFYFGDAVLDQQGHVFADVSRTVPGGRRYTVFGFDGDGNSLGEAELEETVFAAGNPLRGAHLVADQRGGVVIAQANAPVAGESFEVHSTVARLAVGGAVGAALCAQPTPNSSGATGRLRAFGTNARSVNDLTLLADQLPEGATTLFFTGTAEVTSMFPGGSQGILCAGGAIGRYVGVGQVMSSGTEGAATLRLDLMNTPSPTSLVDVLAGETRYFQVWHRDANPNVTSNFTSALAVTFQ